MIDGPVEGAVHIPPGPPGNEPTWSTETRTMHVETQQQLEAALTAIEKSYPEDWAIVYKGGANAATLLSMDLATELFDLGFKLVRDPRMGK